MSREIKFPISVYIQITVFESKITTCALIDTGAEITVFKEFLLPKWIENKQQLTLQGITGVRESLKYKNENIEVIIGSKIVTIRNVYQYNINDCDIILGNDFLQQFSQYSQNIYTIQLKTPCGHLLKIAREFKPFRVQPAQRGEKIEFIPKLLNYSIKTITLDQIKDLLAKNYNENPLEKWEK